MKKQIIYVLVITTCMTVVSFSSFNLTHALFADQARANNNTYTAALSFVTPSLTPTHTPTPTIKPTITPKPTKKTCGGDTTVNVTNNGARSVNTVIIKNGCPPVSVNQSNTTTVINNVSTTQTTGDNVISENTHGTTNITTGNAKSTVEVYVQGASNSAVINN